MKFGQFVRSKLPLCGDCVNCKLQVWDEPKKVEKFRSMNSIRDSENDKNIYFVLNCTWLKQSMFEPQNLALCEGRRTQSEG